MTALRLDHFVPVVHQGGIPDTEPDATEWAVEMGLRMLADYEDRSFLAFVQKRLGWCSTEWHDRIVELIALAGECYDAELCTERGRLAVGLREYADALTTLARGPVAPDDTMAIVDSLDQPRPPLAVVRGGE